MTDEQQLSLLSSGPDLNQSYFTSGFLFILADLCSFQKDAQTRRIEMERFDP